MKRLYVGVLLAVGVVEGGMLVIMARKARTAPPAPPAPVAAQAQTARPADAQAVAAPAEPSPSPLEPPKEVREAPKPGRTKTAAKQPAASPAPGPVEPEPVPPASPAAAAPPVGTPPAAAEPEPVPPARVEPENPTPPLAPAPPEPHKVTLKAGTIIPVRLVDGLSSERNLPGDSFTATLDKELVVDGFVIAERGARVEGRVVASDKGGRVKGVSELEVEVVRFRTSDGQWVNVQTEGFVRRAEESRQDDAKKIGAGAALGAVIGAIAGGGKGAAIGAGVGGGAGAGTVMATRGKAASLPSETRLTFQLKAPVTVTEKLR